MYADINWWQVHAIIQLIPLAIYIYTDLSVCYIGYVTQGKQHPGLLLGYVINQLIIVTPQHMHVDFSG